MKDDPVPTTPPSQDKAAIHTKIWSLDESMVEYAPDNAGVYALWKNGEVIYYGRASEDVGETIKSCLIEHISGLRGVATRRATHYSWEITGTSRARELELLREFWSSFQRFPIANEVEGTDRLLRRQRDGLPPPGRSTGKQ